MWLFFLFKARRMWLCKELVANLRFGIDFDIKTLMIHFLLQKSLVSLPLLLLLALLVGCDKACDVSVTSVVNIDNLTSRDLSIKVCNLGTSSQQSIELTSTQIGEFALETHTVKKIYTGGPPTACDATQQATGIFLTTESFSQFTFCHDPTTSAKLVVIEAGQSCPVGLTAQVKAIDSCN